MNKYSIACLKNGLFNELQIDSASWIKLLENAILLKHSKRRNMMLSGKSIVIFFEKSSTRTRCAIETALHRQGGNATFLSIKDIHLGKHESIEDTAKIFGRFYDGIFYRGYEEKMLKKLSLYSKIPVWNGLTDKSHPTQMLADTMTMLEYNGSLQSTSIAFIGDGRGNIALSLVNTAAILGLDLYIISPHELEPKIPKYLIDRSRRNGGNITISSDISLLAGVKFIYTDVWISMGESHSLLRERIELLRKYRVTMELINKYSPDAYFMHCLPSIHDGETCDGREIKEKYELDGAEVDDTAFKSNNSIVFDQAENRTYTIEALMLASLT